MWGLEKMSDNVSWLTQEVSLKADKDSVEKEIVRLEKIMDKDNRLLRDEVNSLSLVVSGLAKYLELDIDEYAASVTPLKKGNK